MSEAPSKESSIPKSNHLITRKMVREFLGSHPGAQRDADALARWCKTVEQADWRSHADVKATFGPSVDRVGDRTVFDVGGNKYRIIAWIQYKPGKPAWVFLKQVLTHKEYDRGEWKGR